MTTNSTEYQKAYQKEYRKTHPQKQYKKVKMEVKKVKKLVPPRAPVVVKVDKSGDQNIRVEDRVVKMTDSTAESTRAVVNQRPSESKSLAIDLNSMPGDYWTYCDSSEAKRAWNKARFGKVHRGSTQELKQNVIIRNQELDMIELMKKEKSGLYRECMNELKEVLKKRNERR